MEVWDSACMTSPKPQRHLADAIEDLVDAYICEIRRHAESALERAFSRSRTTRDVKSTRARAAGKSVTTAVGARRSSEELVELRERLYEQICARPGESMTVFAEDLCMPARDLQRPMSKLKAEGRVRSVGERNMTRYFPSVGGRKKKSES